MTYMNSQILALHSRYFNQLVQSLDRLAGFSGNIAHIKGYDGYNQLIRINSLFSSAPRGEPSDRSAGTITPLKIYAGRPWSYHAQPIDLGSALAYRVDEIASLGQRINAMWSGGIDSTTMVNALLENLSNRDQLRVLYSPYSTYEHPAYVDFLRGFGIEIVDISGTVYMDHIFDGLFFTGDMGDESYASLDQSFIESHGFDILNIPWRDFFWQQTKDHDFMDFCDGYFSRCGRELVSVLEARWWFYINSKYRCMLNAKLDLWADYPGFDQHLVQSFFDCDYFDQYVTHNIHNIIRNKNYHTWKQDLKDYCLSIDGFHNWNRDKIKVNSNQLNVYAKKKLIMKGLDSLFILTDGRRISTPNMPMFSLRELQSQYGHRLDCLWNEPDQV